MNRGFEYHGRIRGETSATTLWEYLALRYPHSTAAEWRTRIEAGRILLDDRIVAANSKIVEGQTITWRRPPWREPDAPLSFALLHEDRQLLAVAKPAGLPTLPGGGFLEHTLLALVRRRDPQAAPLHRLGRFTSGIVLFGRTSAARAAVSGAWRSGGVRKRYRLLACGRPPRSEFRITAPIGPVAHRLLGTLHAVSARGKPAATEVVVLERRDDGFLADATIETGRPHQIRIHLAAAGHPLVGDPLYGVGGRPRDDALPGDSGYRLHAAELALRHPETGRELRLKCAPPRALRRSDPVE